MKGYQSGCVSIENCEVKETANKIPLKKQYIYVCMQLDFKNLMYDIPGHNAIKVLTVPTSIYKFKKTPIKIQTGMGLGGVGIRGGLDKIFVSYIKKKKEI